VPYAVETVSKPLAQVPQTQPTLRCDGVSNFRSVVRKLWAAHVLWTRQYIISTLAGLPDQPATLQRLLTNQDAIGQSVVAFLGPANGLRLTKLLREHILIAGKIVAAAQAGDQGKVAVEQKEWTANAVAIANLLNKANARWSQATLVSMLQHHLDLTTQEVMARLNKNWANDIAAFDTGFDHMMKFADFLANGMLAMVVALAGARRKHA